MIQGGCPLGHGTGGPGYTFADEIDPDLQFDRPCLLAMANAGPARAPTARSSSSRPAATPWLNGKHTIFGEVADAASRAVVDTLGNVRTGANDKPVDDVVIERVEIED